MPLLATAATSRVCDNGFLICNAGGQETVTFVHCAGIPDVPSALWFHLLFSSPGLVLSVTPLPDIQHNFSLCRIVFSLHMHRSLGSHSVL